MPSGKTGRVRLLRVEGMPLQRKEYNIERVNFLIVEDNKHMSMLIKTILATLGVREAMEAADGADAFKVLRHFAADIIICDWVMQPLDGLDFVRLVRTGKDSPNPYVPIIMLTGYTEMNRVTKPATQARQRISPSPFPPRNCSPASARSSSTIGRSSKPRPISAPIAAGRPWPATRAASGAKNRAKPSPPSKFSTSLWSKSRGADAEAASISGAIRRAATAR